MLAYLFHQIERDLNFFSCHIYDSLLSTLVGNKINNFFTAMTAWRRERESIGSRDMGHE